MGASALPAILKQGNPNIVKQLQKEFNKFVSDCTNGDVRTCSR